MEAIFQTAFSNAFSWTKIHKCRLRFHWSLIPRVQLPIFQHWFRLWLGVGYATNHYVNQWRLVYWPIYASIGLSEFNWYINDRTSLSTNFLASWLTNYMLGNFAIIYGKMTIWIQSKHWKIDYLALSVSSAILNDPCIQRNYKNWMIARSNFN